MNMPIVIATHDQNQAQSFSAQQLMPYVNAGKQKVSDVADNALNPYKVLDQHFALQSGSHKNVKQYIVYFNHIMAFFADGSHCGLAETKQFVAFLGCKEKPESIVFKQDSVHLELVLNAHQKAKQHGQDGVGVQIELPSQTTFTAVTGGDYFVE
jgi:malate synthase